jgi:hypothetical protein
MNWIFCAGMMRSGSTLQFQLTSSIVEHAGMGRRLPYSPESEFESLREQHAGDRQTKVIKAHRCTTAHHALALQQQAKVVYTYRDIRDVAVSAMKKFDKTLYEIIDSYWLEQALADYRKWTSVPDVLISKYENMVANIAQEAERINQFTGAHLAGQTVQEIAADFTLERQRQRIAEFRRGLNRPVDAAEIVFHPIEQLHHNHIDDGAVGKWQDQLSATEIFYLDSKFGDWLLETGYHTPASLQASLQPHSLPDAVELTHLWQHALQAEINRSMMLSAELDAERAAVLQLQASIKQIKHDSQGLNGLLNRLVPRRVKHG